MINIATGKPKKSPPTSHTALLLHRRYSGLPPRDRRFFRPGPLPVADITRWVSSNLPGASRTDASAAPEACSEVRWRQWQPVSLAAVALVRGVFAQPITRDPWVCELMGAMIVPGARAPPDSPTPPHVRRRQLPGGVAGQPSFSGR